MEILSFKSINLKGDVCPITFAKSKLALDAIRSGQVLEIIVDYIPATENIPRSMENEGHKVIEVKKINKTDWRILIQKI